MLELEVHGLDGRLEAGETLHGSAVHDDLPALAAARAAHDEHLAHAARALEVQADAVAAEREPRVARDGAHVLVRPQRQRIEAGGAILDLRERDGARLELETGAIELDAKPRAARLVDVAAAQVEVARRAEQRRQRAQAQLREVDEVQDEAVGLAGVQPRAAADALGVEPLGARGPRHGDARHARIVEALGQDAHVREDLDAPLAKVGQRLRARLARHGAVDDARRDAERVQRVGQVARVVHRHAERDRAPVARQLLERARHERVALLDVDRLGELLLVEVEPRGRELAQIRRRRDAVTAQRREEAVVDELGQRARVDDLLEDLVEPLAVAARRRRREAEQRAREGGLEDAELAQDAQVVIGRRVVALVVDDEPHVAPAQDVREALLVQRADRAHQNLGGG